RVIVARLALGHAGHGPLEGMRVQVGDARHHALADGAAVGRVTDAPVQVEAELDAVLPTVGLPGPGVGNGRHVGILSRPPPAGEHTPPTMAAHPQRAPPTEPPMTDAVSTPGLPWDGLIVGVSLATMDAGDAGAATGYAEVPDGALGWRDGVLTYVVPRSGLPGPEEELAREVVEADRWITPGLVDCHTHLVFAGDRAREFAMRLQGARYEGIARAVGGIVSAVCAVR